MKKEKNFCQVNSKKVNDSSKKRSHKNRNVIAYTISIIAIVLLIIFDFLFSVFIKYYSLLDTENNDFDYNNVVSISGADTEEIIGNNVELPKEDVFSDNNVINILLIGTDERTQKFDPYARADSIMVLSLNQKTHSVKLVSLERGMTVSMPGNKYELLTHTFHYGGAKLVIETVRTHFNLDTDRFIRVNFSVFKMIIDQIGGVDITLSSKAA